ncbi:kinase-like protein [Hortaea werneckii]|nr:kinase-like protein [Hortaea werneckii]KAI7081710.1 kinase-like protein [Hortaea werneckii]KAI7307923.1 kinase-like protein [Hortaea werneckii]KAI7381495.1 kinase-like protein [Hortaea werneckii]
MAAVAHHSRPHIRRTSPVAALHSNNGFSADAPALQRFGMDDSDSDDEPPPAIKFSKVTQALLDDAPMPSSPPKQEHVSEAPRFNRSVSSSKAGLDTPSRGSGIKVIRKSSPSLAGEGTSGTPPRVVQVGKNSGSAQRSVSIAGSYPHRFATRRDPTPEPNGRPEIVTPAPRALRVSRTRANSNASQDEQQHVPSSLSRSASRQGSRYGLDSGDRNRHVSDLSHGASLQQPQETATRFGSSTIGRSRNVSAENAPPGSQRIKRAPIGSGSFLKSGPVRRGFRRRDSEDNVSPAEDASAPGSQPSASNYTPRDTSASRVDGDRSRNGSVSTRATSVEPGSHHDFAYKSHASHESRNANSHLSHSQIGSASRPGSRQAQHDQARSRQASVEPEPVRRRPSVPAVDGVSGTHQHQESRQSAMDYKSYRSDDEQRPAQRRPSLNRANYRVMPSKGHTNGSEDQENMPPPTFRRNKDQDFKYFGKQSVSVMSDDEKPKHRIPQETPVPVPNQQQERKALGTISGNTPHRPAPAPPPKMSVLDAATTTAGASVTKSKKKRSHIVINGKIFTQMGKLGKGGSSDVYCVMAENYKTFALKRVKLDDCDEAAVVGYKGEIDLLRKLTEVERVVRLFDWELNEDKQELLVLMEKGDTDLNRLLTLRLNGIDAKFDSISARYNWKEMLECVQAVHDHDIVHSDLKPANFLIVQGRLKLIDFGIANAIDTDNTCNVHRDSHVGTPNYMSPESITDTNQPPPGQAGSGKDAQGRPLKKDMRIGKASDVWSLGCILYQMTYGRPPFAHIPNQISRIMAITNPAHAITFPDRGVGDAVVPAALKATLKKCLNRDPAKRPSIRQMLSPDDPWLNPDAQPGAVLMTEDLLGQIISKVVARCADPGKGPPAKEEWARYPASFMAKIRELQESG